jgi:RNA polymerase sigma-70 factor (ECF subfamily)
MPLGEETSFSALFETYHRSILGYILRRTGNVEDSADLAADTFHKAWVHIHRWSYRGVPVKVWLYRIASNEVNQYFRRRNRRLRLFGEPAGSDSPVARDWIAEDLSSLEEEMRQHVQFLRVLDALKGLPVKYQEVIALRYFEGKDNKEISAILGKREGTVKSLISRGVEKLKEKIYGDQGLRRTAEADEQAQCTSA